MSQRTANSYTPAYNQIFGLLVLSNSIETQKDLKNIIDQIKYLLLTGQAHESDSVILRIGDNVAKAKKILK